MNLKKATKDSWKNYPMPELKAQLPIHRDFTPEEYEYLSYGDIPQQMEDKWFSYLQDDWLYFHRSWTGLCIFQVRLEKIGASYRIGENWMNKDLEKGALFLNRNDSEVANILLILIHGIIHRNSQKNSIADLM